MHDESHQLTLFGLSHVQEKQQSYDTHAVKGHEWQLYIDGASRNNPGQSGAGIYIKRDGLPLYQEGYFLGIKTNNQAEYLALILGLFCLKKWHAPDDRVLIYSDSQLLVRQLKGAYKVRNELLKPLHRVALSLINTFNAEVAHVMREENTHADKMANQGIDTQKPIPPMYVRMLEHYDVAL